MKERIGYFLLRNIKTALISLVVYLTSCSVQAQTVRNELCGFENVYKKILQDKPYVADTLQLLREGKRYENAKISQNATLSSVPVIFHIVLNDVQLNFLGEKNIQKYVDTQIAILNRDFNALNERQYAVPDVFKAVIGSTGIHFALAKIAPDGNPTQGFDIKKTALAGFDIDGTTGSKVGFSDAKYESAGGVDIWDPTTYLNIWVINPITSNNSISYLGLAIPPEFAISTGVPQTEWGIIINYRNWSKISQSFLGRTLTHEIGHYFGLWHTWGDDNGKCAGNGGWDDGISDTPLQADATEGCPVFPLYDSCSTPVSAKNTGVMFMNFMDYSDDKCRNMFTIKQVERMQRSVSPSGKSFSLTQHPDITAGLAAVTDVKYRISPNPATGIIHVIFDKTSAGLNGIDVVNTAGQIIATTKTATQYGYYSFDMSGAGKGMYFVRLHFITGTEVKKLVLQ